ncbi:MAG: MSMEG_1061 family FMN-dependent PPOX-type flavoprotein [Gaiellales bacterium]
MDSPAFPGQITTTADLEAVYGPPMEAVQQKAIDHLDDHCRDFIALSPFVALAAADADGVTDVSPRGGPPGFVRVLDDRRLVIPDAAGNRTLDVLHRVVAGGRVGLLFTIPGVAETLRVRGTACVTRDPALLDGLQTGGRPAELAIGVVVEAAFLHCAKAFMRSGLWQPETWPDASALARPARIWADHIALDGLDEAAVEGFVSEDYATGL